MLKANSFVKYLQIVAVVFAVLAYGSTVSAELKITYPKNADVVPDEVIEIEGTGADHKGELEVQVMTNRWDLQDGEVTINTNGSWSYGPVHLSGRGKHRYHTIRATVIKNGERAESHTVHGVVVRRD